MKKYNLVFWVFSIPFLSLILYACSNDNLLDQAQADSNATLRVGDECAIHLSAQVETTTWVEPLNPSEEELLERQDKVMGLPKTIKCHVESCIDNNGHRKETVQMMEPEFPITYPDDVAGGEYIKGFNRAEINGNSVTFFDETGDVIHSDFSDGNVEFYTSILEGMGEFQVLSSEDMDLFISVLIDKGFQIENPEAGNVFYLTHTYEDGSSSKVILDKNYQTIRGQENYDETGELESSHYFKMEGPADNPVFTGHSYTTTFVSPFSEVKLAIRRHSKISNYSFN